MKFTLVLILSLSVLASCGGATEGPEPEPVASAPVQTEAPNGTRESPYVGHGTIEEVGRTLLVINHETIPGFMSAMSMAFPVAEEAMIDSLEVGDEITFEIELLEEGYQIFSIEEDTAP